MAYTRPVNKETDIDGLLQLKIELMFLNEFEATLNKADLIKQGVFGRAFIRNKEGAKTGIDNPEVEALFGKNGDLLPEKLLKEKPNISFYQETRYSADSIAEHFGVQRNEPLSLRERLIIDGVLSVATDGFSSITEPLVPIPVDSTVYSPETEKIENEKLKIEKMRLKAPLNAMRNVDFNHETGFKDPKSYKPTLELLASINQAKNIYAQAIDNIYKMQNILQSLVEMEKKYSDLGKTTNLGKIQKLITKVTEVIEQAMSYNVTHTDIAYLQKTLGYVIEDLEKAFKDEKVAIPDLNNSKNSDKFHYQRMLGLLLKNIYQANPDRKQAVENLKDIQPPREYQNIFPQWVGITAPSAAAASAATSHATLFGQKDHSNAAVSRGRSKAAPLPDWRKTNEKDDTATPDPTPSPPKNQQ